MRLVLSPRSLVLVALPLLPLPSHPAAANPVPDAVAQELNHLPYDIVAGASARRQKRFAELVGRYGLGLFDARTKSYMDQHFDSLKPHLIESQRPGHAPHYDVQAWFRERAGAGDREAMCEALRLWLTEPMAAAPPSGGEVITGPSPLVDLLIMRARVTAAEMLSDYGDRRAEPLIQALLTPSLVKEGPMQSEYAELHRPLEQSLRRLVHSDSAAILVPDGRGGVRLCRNLGEAEVLVPRPAKERSVVPLDPHQASTILDLLGRSREGKRSPWGGGGGLVIRFQNGLEATLSPTEKNRVVYSDNTRLEQWQLTIENPELYRVIQGILKPRLED